MSGRRLEPWGKDWVGRTGHCMCWLFGWVLLTNSEAVRLLGVTVYRVLTVVKISIGGFTE